MAVNKNLFLYDLAVVAIMKNEAPYVKEWLDYHLLAGVEHFYIYDNESSDNFKEVLQPYIDAGIVTYDFQIGKVRQVEAYNEARKKYRFFSRYVAFIDSDEFIFPQSNRSITEVVDEILAQNPTAAGLAINWHCFGSNGQEKADYTRGVLERFTRRAPNDWFLPPSKESTVYVGNIHVKTISNPRLVRFLSSPHYANYFEGFHAINEKGTLSNAHISHPVTADKIIINHYVTKSREESEIRSNVSTFSTVKGNRRFSVYDHNEEFDDGILKYRTARQLEAGGGIGAKPIDYLRLTNALIQNLFPATLKNPQPEFFAGKMETFLTCRKLAAFLRENFLDKDFANSLEETALRAVQKTFTTNLTLADVRLLMDEMPEILTLEYPVVGEIHETLIEIIPQILNLFSTNNLWNEFRELEIFLNMLKAYEHD